MGAPGKSRWPLSVRLLTVSTVFVVVALPAVGAALSWSFTSAVRSGLDERLEAVSGTLAASLQATRDGGLTLGRPLGEPRFEQVFSGWYWQVTDADGDVLLVSRSLWDETLPAPAAAGGTQHRTVEGPRDEPVRVRRSEVRLAGRAEPLHVAVAAPMSEVHEPAGRFQRLLFGTLAGLGALLLALLAVQVRWGLAPLRRLTNELHRVESGEAYRLDDDLPSDLAPLARAMNAVLDRDRRLIERGRAAAGNLAHALKTPLAVMKAQVEQLGDPHGGVLGREIERADAAIRHHLARASAAGGLGVAERIDAAEVLRPVIEALRRMAERRGVALETGIPEGARLRMDAQDLQELAGNLLENAIRWAGERVRLRVLLEGERLALWVEDDGPGMAPERRKEALVRGRRLDTGAPEGGSGLGLDIVRDLVDLYHGELALEESELGGLRARVVFSV